MSDITILMSTFNRADALRSTLEAMCHLRTKAMSVDLVVVDNASTDGTPRVLRDFAERLPLRSLHETRPGKSNALNRALETAPPGDIVLFTNDDVTPDPGCGRSSMVTTPSRPRSPAV